MTAPTEPITLTLEEGLAAIFPDTIGRRDDGKWPFFTYMNDEHGHTCTAIFDTWPEAVSWAKGAPIVARDEAAELRAALRTLVADLEALMEESHIELYDGDGNLVGISWGKLLQGGKDEYLSNWRDVKRLAGGEGR